MKKDMVFSIQKWFRICLFNVVIIAVLGFILRYKIAFSLPFVDQKHLLQAHSHFAFSGWISQALMVLMVAFLSQRGIQNAFKKYHSLLLLNLISSYGMLLCFPFEGYGLFSICFSTLSILTAYAFAFVFWQDLRQNRIREIAAFWFKAALIFNAISSLGAFSLAYLMANKIVHQNWYLLAVYFFLHFQYNGWFFFAIGGLWFSKLKHLSIAIPKEKLIFWLFAVAVVPCYFLSTLWLNLTAGIYIVVVLGSLSQVLALVIFGKSLLLHVQQLKGKLLSHCLPVFVLSFLAFSIKILLQLCSTVPSLNQLVYGFRPIVIGYLHLVFLGFISLFILAFSSSGYYLNYNKLLVKGLFIFATGIIVNEALLMVQGIAAMQFFQIPYVNEMLLATAALLFSGAVVLFRSQIRTSS